MKHSAFFQIATFSLLPLLITSCNNSKGSNLNHSDSPLSPDIQFQNFQENGCLTLEKLASHMSRSDFNFPARKTVLQYDSSHLKKRMLIYNFGVEDFKLDRFPLLGEIQQPNCSDLRIKNSYGRWLSYKIKEASPSFLWLVRNKNEPIEKNKPQAITKAQKYEPGILQLKIHLLSSNSLLITQIGETIYPLCQYNQLFSFRKSTLYRWGNPPWTDSEALDPNMMSTVDELSHHSEQPISRTEEGIFYSIKSIKNIKNELKKIDIGSRCDF